MQNRKEQYTYLSLYEYVLIHSYNSKFFQIEAQLPSRKLLILGICHTNGPANAGSNDTDELDCSSCLVRRKGTVCAKDKRLQHWQALDVDVDNVNSRSRRTRFARD